MSVQLLSLLGALVRPQVVPHAAASTAGWCRTGHCRQLQRSGKEHVQRQQRSGSSAVMQWLHWQQCSGSSGIVNAKQWQHWHTKVSTLAHKSVNIGSNAVVLHDDYEVLMA